MWTAMTVWHPFDAAPRHSRCGSVSAFVFFFWRCRLSPHSVAIALHGASMKCCLLPVGPRGLQPRIAPTCSALHRVGVSCMTGEGGGGVSHILHKLVGSIPPACRPSPFPPLHEHWSLGAFCWCVSLGVHRRCGSLFRPSRMVACERQPAQTSTPGHPRATRHWMRHRWSFLPLCIGLIP